MIRFDNMIYQIEPGDVLATNRDYYHNSDSYALYHAFLNTRGRTMRKINLERDPERKTVDFNELSDKNLWSKVVLFEGSSLSNNQLNTKKILDRNATYALEPGHKHLYDYLVDKLHWTEWWLRSKHAELMAEFPEMEGIL